MYFGVVWLNLRSVFLLLWEYGDIYVTLIACGFFRSIRFVWYFLPKFLSVEPLFVCLGGHLFDTIGLVSCYFLPLPRYLIPFLFTERSILPTSTFFSFFIGHYNLFILVLFIWFVCLFCWSPFWWGVLFLIHYAFVVVLIRQGVSVRWFGWSFSAFMFAFGCVMYFDFS